MKLAKVVGTVTATVKDSNFSGLKLLLVQPLSPTRELTGSPIIAVDGVGVGVGEEILFVRGKESGFMFSAAVPSDAGVVAKVCHLDVVESAVATAE